MTVPSLFLERLGRILGETNAQRTTVFFDNPAPVSLRVNTLRWSVSEAREYFTSHGCKFEQPVWSPDAFVLSGVDPHDLTRSDIVTHGKVYPQSPSSMLPVVVLDPKPEDLVLDMCAAPGSKTSQMAARMNNQGTIVAVESVRPRFYRLKSVLELLGVQNVRAKCLDARRFRCGGELFDKVLVDAPCSSESRFKSFEPETYVYWSPRKIKEMVQRQRGILLSACRLIKPGGTLLYSTCTFAPEENEGVIDWLLRKMPDEIDLGPIGLPGVERYPALLKWEKREFDPRVSACFRVLPTQRMEGFFMARLVKRV